MTHYVGLTAQDYVNGNSSNTPRFFYALRRTEQGDLYFCRVDQINEADAIQINVPGDWTEDYPDFEIGVDYFDGRLEEDHTRPFDNLKYDQFRWDHRSMYYYLNEEGELVVRVNQQRNYPTDV